MANQANGDGRPTPVFRYPTSREAADEFYDLLTYIKGATRQHVASGRPATSVVAAIDEQGQLLVVDPGSVDTDAASVFEPTDHRFSTLIESNTQIKAGAVAIDKIDGESRQVQIHVEHKSGPHMRFFRTYHKSPQTGQWESDPGTNRSEVSPRVIWSNNP